VSQSLKTERKLSPGLRRILGNTGWLMIDRIVRMGLGALVGIMVARYLGPSRFGALNFAVSFVALFGTVTTLGLENVLVREIVQNSSKTTEILGTGFAVRMVGSLLAPLLAIATIWLIQPNDRTAILLVSVLSLGLVFQVFDTIDSYFQAQVRSKLTVAAKNTAFLLTAAVRIFLIHVGAPLWEFAAAQVAELALGALGLITAYRYTGGRFSRWRASKAKAIELLTQSWPVILSGMAIMIYFRIDVVMLKMMQGAQAVGIYAAATRISEVWYVIPSAIVSSVTPAIMRARHNPVLYYARLRRLFSLMTFLALTIGSVLALCSRWIVHLLYSEPYSAASPVLAIHAWASVFVFLGVAQAPWDFSENRLKLSFYRTLAGAVANVLLNLVLIPRYAAAGAAVATVVSYAISSVFANALSPLTRPIFLLQIRSVRLTDMFLKEARTHRP